MWKSTASWARGTEGDTAQTAGSQAYKKRLSFPPVHGFREWSAKQENPPPGSKFQAGSRLLTECRDAIPAEVASDVSRESTRELGRGADQPTPRSRVSGETCPT